jgi:cytochrome c oxidase cbb3-type subunit II
MSDLAAASSALGLPETLVQRSAEARAAETGASVDDILAQWAGGEVAPAAQPEPAVVEPVADEDAGEAEPAADTPTEDSAPAAAPEVVIEVPEKPASPPPAQPTGPYKPPVLVGTRDNPMSFLAGVIGLFIVVVMVGLVGPSIPTESPGARTSDIGFSDTALHGQDVYEVTGCGACHTQMVRPVVADVGLGPVTLNDTNQVLGTRRFGPDLADVGSRITASQMEAIIGGLGGHPAHDLAEEDLAALIAYLAESATSLPDEAAEEES